MQPRTGLLEIKNPSATNLFSPLWTLFFLVSIAPFDVISTTDIVALWAEFFTNVIQTKSLCNVFRLQCAPCQCHSGCDEDRAT